VDERRPRDHPGWQNGFQRPASRAGLVGPWNDSLRKDDVGEIGWNADRAIVLDEANKEPIRHVGTESCKPYTGTATESV